MRRKLVFQTVGIVLLLSMLACSFPGFISTPEPLFATPNQTMTALFSRPTLEASQTPVVITATPEMIPSVAAPSPIPVWTTVAPTPTQAMGIPTVLVTPLYPTVIVPTAVPYTPPVLVRSVARTEALYLSTPPLLDGVWDEWPGTTYPIQRVVYGGGNWSGENDLEGSFKVGWDTQYLYVAVKVLDDVYAQNDSGAYLYRGDSLEVLLDADLAADFYTRQTSPDDFQLGISPGRPDVNGVREAYLWQPKSIAGLRQVQIASMRSDGVYRVEVAIPWSLFGVSPYRGARFGFGVSVSDNDDTTQNLQQSMISNLPGRKFTDPTTWGDLELR